MRCATPGTPNPVPRPRGAERLAALILAPILPRMWSAEGSHPRTTLLLVLVLPGLLALGWGLGYLWARPKAEPLPTPQAMARQPQLIPDTVVVSASEPKPPSTPSLLPTETLVLYCFYRLERYPAETPLTVEWRLNGQPLGTLPLEDHRRERGTILAGRFLIRPPQGAQQFAPGLYQLIFRSGTETLEEASFVLAAEADRILGQQPPPAGEIRVVNLVTCAGLDPQGKPLSVAQSFAPRAKIYALFTYVNGVKQTRFEVRWLFGDLVIPQATQQIEMQAGAGQAYAWLQASGEGLPPGQYQVQVLLAGGEQPLATAQFAIGQAQAPPPPPAPPARR